MFFFGPVFPRPRIYFCGGEIMLTFLYWLFKDALFFFGDALTTRDPLPPGS